MDETLTKLLDIIPPHWRSTALAVVLVFPYATRIAHALYSGNGIVGAIKGLLFGTNVPKQKETETKTQE